MITKNNNGKFSKGHTSWNKNKRINLDINLIVNKYYNKEKSTHEIAKELNVTQKTIENRLKENGYKLRSKIKPTQKTKQKISDTMKEKGIQPTKRYSGKPTKGCFKKRSKPWNKGKTGLQVSNKKGKTYEEIYGEENANKFKAIIKQRRSTQVLPVKDTSIEIKIQNLLKQLGIEFATHQYMKDIEHGYQCDIMIPVQKGIDRKTIIEVFGDYWHNRPIGREIDIQRCNELRENGWRVLVFWENEIKPMELNDLKLKVIA